MSEENIETMRQAMEAFNRGDRDAWLLLHDPDFEFRADPEWPESERVRGREAVWDFSVKMTDAWEPDPFEMVEVVEAGRDRVAARFRRPVRGKASGIVDELDYWTVTTFSRGELLSQHWYANRAKALEAAGLSE